MKGGRRRGENERRHERLGERGRGEKESRAGRLPHSLIGNGPDSRPFSTLSGKSFLWDLELEFLFLRSGERFSLILDSTTHTVREILTATADDDHQSYSSIIRALYMIGLWRSVPPKCSSPAVPGMPVADSSRVRKSSRMVNSKPD